MIDEIYTKGLLAAAAYADWGDSSTQAEIKAELLGNRGFTQAQIDTFFFGSNPKYEVIPNGYFESLNGFSATIFKNVDSNSPNYNQLTVAFRGTEPKFPWVDFLTDLSAVLGNPGGWLELFNQTNNIDKFLMDSGLLSNGQLTQAVDFTGHSLGGYLSIMAAYKYSSSFGEAYTYNWLKKNFTLTPIIIFHFSARKMNNGS